MDANAGPYAPSGQHREPIYFECQKPKTPLATGLLALALSTVLIAVTAPAGCVPSAADLAGLALLVAIGGIPGGILSLIMVLYYSDSWSTILASYFAGSAVTVVAVRLLVAPHQIRIAMAGAALLLLFGLLIRLTNRQPSTELLGTSPLDAAPLETEPND